MFRKIYEPVQESGFQPQSKKIKRYRSAFTTGQINYLEKQFKKCPYIGSATRKEVANVLNIPERAIKIWFQNRRMKEKKEVNNKEHESDRQNIFKNNVAFTKDSLNNVHSFQSANDRQCSLKSTVTNQVDKNNTVIYNTSKTDYSKFSDQIQIRNVSGPIVDYDRSYIFKNTDKMNCVTQKSDQAILSRPANLGEYHSNNMYNERKFVMCLEKNKKGQNKRKVIPKASTKSGSLPQVLTNKAPTNLPGCQDTPEDLSASKQPNVMIPQHPYRNMNLSSPYVPFCNTENVCLPAANVIWKPVNVMSILSPNGLPISVPEMQPHELNQNKSTKCNCNCTMRNRMHYQQGIMGPQPQYVIAIPYNNSSNIL